MKRCTWGQNLHSHQLQKLDTSSVSSWKLTCHHLIHLFLFLIIIKLIYLHDCDLCGLHELYCFWSIFTHYAYDACTLQRERTTAFLEPAWNKINIKLIMQTLTWGALASRSATSLWWLSLALSRAVLPAWKWTQSHQHEKKKTCIHFTWPKAKQSCGIYHIVHCQKCVLKVRLAIMRRTTQPFLDYKK